MRVSSLRARLRWLILAVVAAVLLPLGLASFQRTLIEVNELSDGRLAQSARTLDVLLGESGDQWFSRLASDKPGLIHSSSVAAVGATGHHFETEVGFQVLDSRGQIRLYSDNLKHLGPPEPHASGYEDIRFDSHEWRVFTMRDDDSHLVIRMAERYDSRNEITRAMLLEHALPLLLGLPLLALLLGWAIERGLRPLDALSQALHRREPGDRVHIALADTPRELQPVVDNMNRQFDRLEDSLDRERRFSADVAHELRTPLAAAQVHLHNATTATSDPSILQPLASLDSDLRVLSRRVGQLLSLARLEAGAAFDARHEVDLVAIATEVVEELALIIADKRVDMIFATVDSRVMIRGYDAALRAILRNLVENALRFVGVGGQVEIRLVQASSWTAIEVSDDGPGIPLARREAVFARFERAAGSDGFGLGLSIVKRAAQLHDAPIELLDSAFGRGLCVRVELPTSGATRS